MYHTRNCYDVQPPLQPPATPRVSPGMQFYQTHDVLWRLNKEVRLHRQQEEEEEKKSLFGLNPIKWNQLAAFAMVPKIKSWVRHSQNENDYFTSLFEGNYYFRLWEIENNNSTLVK